MKRSRWMALAAGTALAAAAAMALLLCPSPFVHADGTKLGKGCRSFEVRGAALMDDATLWDPAKTEPSPDGIKERDWAFTAVGGMNAARLAVKTDYFIDAHNRPKESGFAWLGRQLAFARRAGLLVLLDLHVPPGGAVQDYRPTSANAAFWSDAALQQRFVEGWRQIASRCRDDRTIMGYELMNEPAGDPQAYWALMERTVAAIRGVDLHHLIVLQLPLGGGVPRIADGNVAFAAHFYTPMSFTHQNVPWAPAFASPERVAYSLDRDALRAALAEATNATRNLRRPLILGEFGVSTSADEDSIGRWLGDVVGLVNELGFAGSLYWRQIDRSNRDLAAPNNSTMAVINADGSYYSPAQFFGIRPGFAAQHPGFDAKSFYLNSRPNAVKEVPQ